VILVTSANGHIGKEVVNVLRSRGMKARAFVRKVEREQEDQSGVLEYFKGDFFDRESLRRAFVGVDRVMHISPPHIPGEFVVLSDDKHFSATYELVGTEPITARELASLVSQESGRSIEAKQISPDAIIDRLPRTSVIDAFTSDAFERMFVYYNRHGLTGNSNVLGWLLGRNPTDFPEYVRRASAEKQ
jgi:uncharacterized protein YbjT (DUF2867 family)